MKSSWKSALASLILALLALVCVGCAGAAEDGRIRVGITVYPDVKRNGITEQDAQVITNALTDGLAGTGNIKLYERRQLDAALEELRIGGSAVIDENTAVEIGKIVGLQFILTGSVTSLGRKESRSSLIVIKGYQTTVTEDYEVNIRMIDVATSEVRLSFSEYGSAKETYSDIMGLSSSKEAGALRTRAIRSAMPELIRRIRGALAAGETYVSLPRSEQPSEYQPSRQIETASDPAEQWDFDPNQSNRAEVIMTYPLSAGDRNLLIIGHNAAFTKYRNRKYKEAYAAFVKLAEEYEGNYLAAYWAGESALRLKNKHDATAYFERAVGINPEYVPARKALEKLD